MALADRLRGGLSRTREVLNTPIEDLVRGRRPLDAAALESVEEALLAADMGVPAVQDAMAVLEARSGEIASPIPPFSWRRAARAAPAVLAAIRSERASACVRSIFSFWKALRENSPGAAGTAPRSHAAVPACSTSTGLPCRWISATSSPVKLLGAGK